jgi:two-component system, OmpR family, sensor histidine kinase BaeS
MTVRMKLFIAMFSLTMIVGLIYIGTTQGFLGSQFTKYEQQKTIERLQSEYKNNGNTWNGLNWDLLVQEWEQEKLTGGSLRVLSLAGDELFHAGKRIAEKHSEEKIRPIYVDHMLVGTAYFYNWNSEEIFRLKKYILDLMLNEAIRVTALTAIVTIIVGLWLSALLTNPLRRLLNAIGKIASGERDFQVPVKSADEYGRVAMAFNEMTRQLQLAEMSRKRLIADVAHELRTPLSIMQSKLEVIQENGRSVAPETLLPLQDEIIRLTRLVADLYQLTLAEAGKLEIVKHPTDLNELIERTMDIFREEADRRGVTFSLSSFLDDDHRIVLIDPARMRQVLYNLVANAIQYTPEGSSIRIEAWAQKTGDTTAAAISISDSGIGIPEDQIPYLFERFYRVEEARTRHTGGMGLGLAIANEFVKAHGGSIEVESTVGLGTTFRVYLP